VSGLSVGELNLEDVPFSTDRPSRTVSLQTGVGWLADCCSGWTGRPIIPIRTRARRVASFSCHLEGECRRVSLERTAAKLAALGLGLIMLAQRSWSSAVKNSSTLAIEPNVSRDGRSRGVRAASDLSPSRAERITAHDLTFVMPNW
jgi:hypothetical protein